MSAALHAILAVTRTVPDLDAAATFYAAAMDFEATAPAVALEPGSLALLGLEGQQGFTRTLRLGEETIRLLQFPGAGGRPYPADSTSSDLWFQHCAIVVDTMEAAYTCVMRAGARPISEGGPQQLPPNTGGVSAFKFRDPYGHPLELLFFPPGVGDPTWHGTRAPLFRGIDHTAIAVAEAAASQRFYRDALGLRVVDRSRNTGPEQVRLDAVPDDRVDVVALKAATTPPHLELLAYLVGTRRPAPVGNGADAAKARTLAEGDIDAIASSLGREIRRGQWQGRPAIAFDDPDGHGWIVLDKASTVR